MRFDKMRKVIHIEVLTFRDLLESNGIHIIFAHIFNDAAQSCHIAVFRRRRFFVEHRIVIIPQHAKPVSYTHLDVYKRQVLRIVHEIASNEHSDFHLLLFNLGGKDMKDVYKRQRSDP